MKMQERLFAELDYLRKLITDGKIDGLIVVATPTSDGSGEYLSAVNVGVRDMTHASHIVAHEASLLLDKMRQGQVTKMNKEGN